MFVGRMSRIGAVTANGDDKPPICVGIPNLFGLMFGDISWLSRNTVVSVDSAAVYAAVAA
jgi:hypothetical protein